MMKMKNEHYLHYYLLSWRDIPLLLGLIINPGLTGLRVKVKVIKKFNKIIKRKKENFVVVVVVAKSTPTLQSKQAKCGNIRY